MNKLFKNPSGLFALTFLFLIIVGSILLSIPGVNLKQDYTFVDALFTATSAVCVTGLTTFPVSSFTFVGQVIILTLIQLGGIGIMSLSTFIVLFLRGELDLRGRISVSRLSGTLSIGEADKIITFIFKYMFCVEILGAFFLFIGFLSDNFNIVDAAYYSIFYTISAFCNAGFSIFDESLVNQGAYIKIVISALIILGGLGFYAVFDIVRFFKSKNRLRNHTRIVIITTIFLIIAGAALIYIAEFGKINVIDAYFQSVTARTAGFNTVDIAKLHQASIFVILILMVIGGSPGSTAGGIKTTTYFVILLADVHTLRGERRVKFANREVPYENILRAHTILFLYILFISSGTIVLLLHNDYGFLNAIFEVTSAIGTVGLSMGVTSQLDTIGKLVIITLMYVGRIGPTVLFMLLLKKEKKTNLKYPEEKLILG